MPKAVAEKTTEQTVNLEVSGAILGAILQPRISEKSGMLAKSGKYVFVVPMKTNKIEVKKAVERAYKVKVVQVNMIKTDGKLKTSGRSSYRTGDLKKAIVTVKEGDKIEGFSDLA